MVYFCLYFVLFLFFSSPEVFDKRSKILKIEYILRLPQDVYQTAKIAKLLLIIDRGEAHKYKGKDLQDLKVEETDCLEIENEENQKG